MAERKQSSLIARVHRGIHEAKDNVREFMRGLGSLGRRVKVEAAVAAALFAGDTLTDSAVKAIQSDLEGLDVHTERSAQNYYWAGRVIIGANLTDEQVRKVTLSTLHAKGQRLVKAEACHSFAKVRSQLEVWDAESQIKRREKEAVDKQKADARKLAAEGIDEDLQSVADDPARCYGLMSVLFSDVWSEVLYAMQIEDESSVDYKSAIANLGKFIASHATLEMEEELTGEEVDEGEETSAVAV